MKLNRIILPLMACALTWSSCDDQIMEWKDSDGSITASDIPLALKEKIANYDYIKSYVAQYAPNMNVGLGLGPGLDGFGVLAEIRKYSDTPVIMLTARGSTGDRIQGLETGADDYVAKPFESKELVARIKAVLRRSGVSESDDSDKLYTLNGLSISMKNYLVTIDDNKIEMTPKEIELLYFLATHPDKVFTRDELLSNVWHIEISGDTRTVDVHIKRIREKLGPEYAQYVATVWAVGYKFDTSITNSDNSNENQSED